MFLGYFDCVVNVIWKLINKLKDEFCLVSVSEKIKRFFKSCIYSCIVVKDYELFLNNKSGFI